MAMLNNQRVTIKSWDMMGFFYLKYPFSGRRTSINPAESCCSAANSLGFFVFCLSDFCSKSRIRYLAVSWPWARNHLCWGVFLSCSEWSIGSFLLPDIRWSDFEAAGLSLSQDFSQMGSLKLFRPFVLWLQRQPVPTPRSDHRVCRGSSVDRAGSQRRCFLRCMSDGVYTASGHSNRMDNMIMAIS